MGLLALAGGAARAQQAGEWDPERVVATRPGLEQLRNRLTLASQSTAYSPHLRSVARGQAALIDRRLTEGDFHPGDRIYLQVEGEVVVAGTPSMTDTFTVGPSREITVPVIGVVPLAGVLRADVQPYMKTYLGRYLRNPVVQARPLIPLSVLGHVVHAGFFTVQTGVPLTQVLNLAGVGPDGDLSKVTIRRDTRVIWEGPALQQAMAQGRTLEQLGLRSGDQVEVGGGQTNFYYVFQTIEYGLGIPLAIFSVVQLVKGK